MDGHIAIFCDKGLVAEVYHNIEGYTANAELICAAVNACKEINAESPMAVAQNITNVREKLFDLLPEIAFLENTHLDDTQKYYVKEIKAIIDEAFALYEQKS